jgi:C4-dicarboxylate-specific signal transduction histidine kinase
VELEVTLSHSWVVLSVPDSGPRITSKRAGTYDGVLFLTPKPVRKGTGPGLSISRSIALEQLGHTGIESAVFSYLHCFKTSAHGRSLTRPSKWN